VVDEHSVATWIERYERAWRRAGTDHLSELFAPSAAYRGSPFGVVHRGLTAIAELWERERDGPNERFTLTYEVVAVSDPRAVARLEVRYDPPDGQLYRDLWVLEFADDGRCQSFEEWPFWPAGSKGVSVS
jgi:hypothetical protein